MGSACSSQSSVQVAQPNDGRSPENKTEKQTTATSSQKIVAENIVERISNKPPSARTAQNEKTADQPNNHVDTRAEDHENQQNNESDHPHHHIDEANHLRQNNQANSEADHRHSSIVDPPYSLIYFTGYRLKAEPSRLIMRFCSMKYKDELVPPDKWIELKDNMPMLQLPVLRTSQGDLCQSLTIARYLATENELTGANNWEAARIDMLMDGFMDLINHLYPTYTEKDEGLRGDLWRQAKEEYVLPFMNFCELCLAENTEDWFVGEKVSWADLALADFFHTLTTRWDMLLMENYPRLKSLCDRVSELPGIKEYLLERPDLAI